MFKIADPWSAEKCPYWPQSWSCRSALDIPTFNIEFVSAYTNAYVGQGNPSVILPVFLLPLSALINMFDNYAAPLPVSTSLPISPFISSSLFHTYSLRDECDDIAVADRDMHAHTCVHTYMQAYFRDILACWASVCKHKILRQTSRLKMLQIALTSLCSLLTLLLLLLDSPQPVDKLVSQSINKLSVIDAVNYLAVSQ